MQMILGKIICPSRQQCLEQSGNIGGNLRWQRREIALKREARRDYQPLPQEGKGIVRSIRNDERIANTKANLRSDFRLCWGKP